MSKIETLQKWGITMSKNEMLQRVGATGDVKKCDITEGGRQRHQKLRHCRGEGASQRQNMIHCAGGCQRRHLKG